ncbi:hypothetical protein MZO42_08225 [Sphingomonas psychrotolerans]|uniref:Uncharacterized protein n=1 Tax=Sphingomonas psychrotolerans TaxID=1327635 RepID=A0ABU3N348_9SPHN|nr:hypothetical protein [Sphingomonas psychrotolerans]MDT8758681.1 hypothetical protein [Sphingomonas psychrotolerans]
MMSDIVEADALTQPESRPLATPQRAATRLRIGERFAATAEVEVTPAGLLAIGGMVGAILLGAAVVVRAAKR